MAVGMAVGMEREERGANSRQLGILQCTGRDATGTGHTAAAHTAGSSESVLLRTVCERPAS